MRRPSSLRSRLIATVAVPSLAFALTGCGGSEAEPQEETVEAPANEQDAQLPVAGIASEKQALQQSIRQHLEPTLNQLREAGAHKPPGLWTIVEAPANAFTIPREPEKWFKSSEIVDLDHMKIRVFTTAQTAQVTYRRSTFRGARFDTEAQAQASKVDWEHQTWTAEFTVTYELKDDDWSCLQTDYVATLYLPDGRPGQTQKHSRPGIDFLQKELDSVKNPIQAN